MEGFDFDEADFFRRIAESGDLIATKRFAGRPKDSEDIRLLESLKRDGGTP